MKTIALMLGGILIIAAFAPKLNNKVRALFIAALIVMVILLGR